MLSTMVAGFSTINEATSNSDIDLKFNLVRVDQVSAGLHPWGPRGITVAVLPLHGKACYCLFVLADIAKSSGCTWSAAAATLFVYGMLQRGGVHAAVENMVFYNIPTKPERGVGHVAGKFLITL